MMLLLHNVQTSLAPDLRGQQQFRWSVPSNVAPPPQIGSIIVRQEFLEHPKSQLTFPLTRVDVVPPIQRAIRTLPQEQPYHPASRIASAVIPGNVGPPVDAESSLNIPTLLQEQPYHPTSRLYTLYSVDPFINMNMFLIDDGSTQEQPSHPTSRLSTPLIPGNVGPPGDVESSLNIPTLPQEQPYHPAPQLRSPPPPASVSIPPIQPSIIRILHQAPSQPILRFVFGVYLTAPPPIVVLTLPLSVGQEQPSYPKSQLTFPLIPGNVGPPVDVESSLNIPTLPQEQPYHPQSRLLVPLIPGNVAPPVDAESSLNIPTLPQEQPYHPTSQLRSPPPPVPINIPPIQRTIRTLQEQPYHPGPNFWSYPPSSASLAISILFMDGTLQEQPYHPQSQLSVPLIPGNVAPPVDAESSLNIPTLPQEQPYHPAPQLRSPPPPASVSIPPIQRTIRTLHEQPYWPSPVLRAQYIIGNVAAPPQIGKVQTAQEWPFHPQPSMVAGATFVTPPIIPAVMTPLLVRQEPWSQTPLRFVFGVYLNAPMPALGISLIQNQHLPKQPLPILSVGASFVAAPVVQTPVMVPRKVPDHPSSLLSNSISFTATTQVEFNGIFMGAEEPIPIAPILSPSPLLGLPPIVLSAEYRAIIVTQRLPDHPVSRFNIGIQGPNVAPPPHIGSVFIKQEQPYHPPSQIWNYPPTSIPVYRVGTQLITVQEYPYHPPSMLFFTGYTPEFASPGPSATRILFNTKIRVRTLVNKSPRTIRYS